jgi:hypothetical protein
VTEPRSYVAAVFFRGYEVEGLPPLDERVRLAIADGPWSFAVDDIQVQEAGQFPPLVTISGATATPHEVEEIRRLLAEQRAGGGAPVLIGRFVPVDFDAAGLRPDDVSISGTFEQASPSASPFTEERPALTWTSDDLELLKCIPGGQGAAGNLTRQLKGIIEAIGPDGGLAQAHFYERAVALIDRLADAIAILEDQHENLTSRLEKYEPPDPVITAPEPGQICHVKAILAGPCKAPAATVRDGKPYCHEHARIFDVPMPEGDEDR